MSRVRRNNILRLRAFVYLSNLRAGTINNMNITMLIRRLLNVAINDKGLLYDRLATRHLRTNVRDNRHFRHFLHFLNRVITRGYNLTTIEINNSNLFRRNFCINNILVNTNGLNNLLMDTMLYRRVRTKNSLGVASTTRNIQNKGNTTRGTRRRYGYTSRHRGFLFRNGTPVVFVFTQQERKSLPSP